MWCCRIDAIAASRHEEFEGRSPGSGSQAELYTEQNTTETNRYVNSSRILEIIDTICATEISHRDVIEHLPPWQVVDGPKIQGSYLKYRSILCILFLS